MDRTTWTDERLDDLADRMDAGFARVDADMRSLRTDLTAEIRSLRTIVLLFNGSLTVGLLGVIATLLAQGG